MKLFGIVRVSIAPLLVIPLLSTAAAATTIIEARTSATAPDFSLPGNRDVNQEVTTSRSDDSAGLAPTVAASSSASGERDNAASAAASVDYATGALRAFGRAIPDAGGPGISANTTSSSVVGTAIADLEDIVTFTVAPDVIGPVDVDVIWRVDRVIDDGGYYDDPRVSPTDPSLGTVTSIFEMRRDVFGAFDVSSIDRFDTSGSKLLRDTITLAGPGSFDYSLRFELSVSASNAFALSGGDFRTATVFSTTADASNTAFLNFVTPEGVTFAGGSDGFLSRAPDLTAAPIPLPAAGWMLLAGVGALSAARRRGV